MLTEGIRAELKRAMNPTFSDGVGYRTATSTTKTNDAVEFQLGTRSKSFYIGVTPNNRGTGVLYVYAPDVAAFQDTHKHPEVLREVSSDCMQLEAELERLAQQVFDKDTTLTLVRDDRYDGIGTYFAVGIPPETAVVPYEQ